LYLKEIVVAFVTQRWGDFSGQGHSHTLLRYSPLIWPTKILDLRASDCQQCCSNNVSKRHLPANARLCSYAVMLLQVRLGELDVCASRIDVLIKWQRDNAGK